MLDNIYAYIIKVIVEKDDDGSYYAHVPGLRGVNVSSKTPEEALNIAQKDIINILKIRFDRGQSLPESKHIKALRSKPADKPIALRDYLDTLKDYVDDSYLFTVPPYLAKQLAERESTI